MRKGWKRGTPLAERFDYYTCPEPNSGCILWTGHLSGGNGRGDYGSLNVNGKWRRAHQLAWELAGRTIPNGMILLHSCDVPLCVNVRHLSLGTRLDNSHDMTSKRRGTHGSLPYGVRKHGNRFYTTITFERHRRILGYFDTVEEASACAENFRVQYICKAVRDRREAGMNGSG